MKLTDIVGQTFGRLTVVSLATKGKHTYWNCVCACGVNKRVDSFSLRSGKTKSCGCLRTELRTKHGHAPYRAKPSPEYSSWQHMKQRCYNPKYKHYNYYGGRGITVCPQWLNSFEQFLADMGPSEGLTLERLDSNKNYEPENCVWATRREQYYSRRCMTAGV